MRLHVQQTGNRELRILRYRRIRKGTNVNKICRALRGLTNIPGLLTDITVTQGSVCKIIINNLSKVVVLLKKKLVRKDASFTGTRMPDRRDQCRDVSLWQSFPMHERSSIAKEIWKPMNLRKFGYDISKRPNADCLYTHYM